MALHATVLQPLFAMSVDASIHRLRLLRVAADPVLAIEPGLIGLALVPMALFALQLPDLHVRRMTEEDVLGLVRIHRPFGLAPGRHVLFDEHLLGRGRTRGRRVAAGALL